MKKFELNNFYNNGFGWICKRCEIDFTAQNGDSDKEASRLMREGEAESKQPKFSNAALAKWADAERKSLICPRCGAIESLPG